MNVLCIAQSIAPRLPCVFARDRNSSSALPFRQQASLPLIYPYRSDIFSLWQQCRAEEGSSKVRPPANRLLLQAGIATGRNCRFVPACATLKPRFGGCVRGAQDALF